MMIDRLMKWFLMVILGSVLLGCSTHFTTLNQDNAQSRVIYQIPEEQAFQIAHYAMTSTFPHRAITKIDGPTKGYSTYFRIMLDTFTQQILIFPVIGRSNGNDINGYYFEVSGNGTTVIGRQKNVEMFEKLNKALIDTGRRVVVTDIRSTKYDSDKTIEGDDSKSAMQNSMDKSSSDVLRELKKLHDDGVISDDEFLSKKKEILQRM